MKKQFFRVKQLVDQTVSRAEQSEVLTEDVQSAEKHVELLKQTCGTMSKKISSLLSKSDGAQVEKRLKKIPESAVGHTMIECGGMLGDKSIFRELLTDCGQLGTSLGSEMLCHEIDVEKNVVEPLNQVENEAANITKARRNLKELILDMDSARTRYKNAQKQVVSGGSVTKVDVIKEEMEEAQVKVEMARDSLSADIYSLLAKESDFAKMILHYFESQRDYHRKALALLDENIPYLVAKWKAHVQKPVFGCDLLEHLDISGRTIAHPIEICVITLYEMALGEEGIFRIAGGASKVRKFRAALDANCADLGFALELRDVHIIAGILKSYLRELPDPVLSHSLYEEWVNAVKSSDLETRLHALNEVINKLPETRWNNVRYLIKFFHELSRHQEHNKMTAQNLAIVLAPSLLWSPASSGDVLSMNMSMANVHASVVEHLISYSDRFFPGEIDFYVTYSRPLYTNLLQPPSPLNGGFTDRDDSIPKEEERTHRRMGSSEGLVELRHHGSTSGYGSETSTVKAESPRPISRKKNKPAPVPPGVMQGVSSPISKVSPQAKTPEKEERRMMLTSSDERPTSAEKPSLPPTGPDSKRLANLSGDKKPVLAPRPTVNPYTDRAAAPSQLPLQQQSSIPIGFETIESELKRQGSLRQSLPPFVLGGSAQKSDDESVESRKPPPHASTHKRLSSLENVITVNPTPHPNAVSMFGAYTPTPLDRTKFEGEKSRPSIPERPSVIKLQQTPSNPAPDSQSSPSDGKTGGPAVLERVHSFSVNKQQVSIVQVNKSHSPPLTLNSSDHADIQFADAAEESSPAATAPSHAEAARPERPPKPERLLHPSNGVESNNNIKSEPVATEEEAVAQSASGSGTLPRPAPRPQPPLPPTKPRPVSDNGLTGGDSTDL